MCRNVHGLLADRQVVAIQPSRQQHLLGDLRQPDRLGGDDLQQRAPAFLRELDVLAQERLGSAVDTRHRRPQLVGDGRDELALGLLEPALGGQVSERVDDALGAAHGHERQPELGAVELERQRHRAAGRAALPHRDPALDRCPARQHVHDRPAARLRGVAAGDQLGGPVPGPDDAFVVHEHDPVADRLEDVGRLLTLGRHGLGADACRGLRFGRLV